MTVRVWTEQSEKVIFKKTEKRMDGHCSSLWLPFLKTNNLRQYYPDILSYSYCVNLDLSLLGKYGLLLELHCLLKACK